MYSIVYLPYKYRMNIDKFRLSVFLKKNIDILIVVTISKIVLFVEQKTDFLTFTK